MRTFEVSLGTVFVSDDVHDSYLAELTEHDHENIVVEDIIEYMLENLFSNRVSDHLLSFFDTWKERAEGVAILDAHGARINDRWYFRDGTKRREVQSWIDEVDGRFGTIILCVCDEPTAVKTPTTKKSLLFFPDGLVGNFIAFVEEFGVAEAHHFTLFHPKYGEITDYTAEHAKKSLLITL